MPEEPEALLTVPISEEMSRSYLNYAMSVIIARALPDVRDGLKPVQRRILYAMREGNWTADRARTKCAQICGACQGNYHPHGQEVIYPTLVRMGQDFSLRYPLIDPQGNFGSIDGDPPAAMRYTEARLSRIAMEMLEDIDRETVDWTPNYLQTVNEPMVLPGKFPNLLCNGASGIAVGMATNMPPHNLCEVVDAVLLRMEKPNCTLDEIMKVLPGPDFPTYGLILGTKGIRNMYETGRGSIHVQAKTAIETAEGGRSVIVVSEIPYQVNKQTLVLQIAEIIRNKKQDAISNVVDYSDRKGMRVEISIKREGNPQKVLNYLLKHTSLRTTFGAIMLSLVEGVPRVAPVTTLLDEYIRHRRSVIERRTRYELNRALEEAHISEGYQIARANIEAIIKLIRESEDAEEARREMVLRFGMTMFQANVILNMQLRRLTRLEQQKLEDDYKSILRRIANLLDILSSPARLDSILRDELADLRKRHGDERRTKIVPHEADEIGEEDMIPDEPTIICISRDNYIKRMSVDAFRSQRRGGKGVVGQTVKQEDEVAQLFEATTHNYILFFTDKGRVYRLKAYEIPESGRYSKGTPVINYIQIESGERVTAVMNVRDIQGEGYLVMVTRRGEAKRTPISAFGNLRANGLRAFDIEEGDELGWVMRSRGDQDLLLITRNGMSIRFSEKQLTGRSRAAGGVRGMTVAKDDEVVSADIVDNSKLDVLVVGENGFGKRTPLEEYRPQQRGGKGLITMNVTAKTGKVIGAEIVDKDDKLVVMSSRGKAIRVRVKEIRQVGRIAQGVKIIDLAPGDSVSGMARVVKETDSGEE
ncbi:MAG: DNA gyrase subunit A [Armatimonadetes bacterium]|nr:DNA gyrase subunit A [Armatimonadota bacterium]NOG92203.1 DNA gyrase subunit A [Armatimonadota bacterium]